MAVEMKDIRSKVTPEAWAVLSSIADAQEKEFSEFIREILTDRADTFVRAAKIAERRLRVEGCSGLLGDK